MPTLLSFNQKRAKSWILDVLIGIGVEINIESNVSTVYRPEEKDKLKLEIIARPSAIDNFQKELFNLAKNEDETAILFGNDNKPDY